jgi:hypothetical protein
MFSRKPKDSIETGEMPIISRIEEAPARPERGRTAGRNLTIFKSLVLAVLLAIMLYGVLDRGLSGTERWLPVAIAILGLVFISLFIVDYFTDVPRIAWVLVALLTLLVAVKGLSLTWSISRTETVQELLRSSMYLATFTLAAASLSSRRLVGPFIDGLNLVAGVVAGYGILQKVRPVEYPSNAPDQVSVGSTLEYANTVAVVLGMGIVLGLARMTQLKNPFARGIYAALILVFGVVLYLTFSRGGILALGTGLVVLFAVGGSRLQMLANLLLVSGPLVWLVSRAQELGSLFEYEPSESTRVADGTAFGLYLAVATVLAFLLQAIYATLIRRYQPGPTVGRLLGVAAIVVVLAGAGALGYLLLGEQQGSDVTPAAFSEDVRYQLPSVSLGSRSEYWTVAWDAWKERPLTGTGAGTFVYTWQENRSDFGGVGRVHNVYLEQGTETGVVAFLALVGFAALLAGYLAWRAVGERKVLLSGLTAAAIIYLFSSALEWHWYIPPSTIFFFALAGVAVKYASGTERDT